MKYREDKVNFRIFLSSEPKGLPALECFGNSPTCLRTYIETRYGQTMCLRCLAHNDLLGYHPVKKAEGVIRVTKTLDDITTYQDSKNIELIEDLLSSQEDAILFYPTKKVRSLLTTLDNYSCRKGDEVKIMGRTIVCI